MICCWTCTGDKTSANVPAKNYKMYSKKRDNNLAWKWGSGKYYALIVQVLHVLWINLIEELKRQALIWDRRYLKASFCVTEGFVANISYFEMYTSLNNVYKQFKTVYLFQISFLVRGNKALMIHAIKPHIARQIQDPLVENDGSLWML